MIKGRLEQSRKFPHEDDGWCLFAGSAENEPEIISDDTDATPRKLLCRMFFVVNIVTGRKAEFLRNQYAVKNHPKGL